ncbi:MAG: PASTA domain-containing protein [Thermoleophilia bacterium]
MSSVCRSCGNIAEGDPDFCPTCGEYLRWEPTGYQKAAEPAAPAAPAAPAGPPAPAPPAAAPPAGGAALPPAAPPAAAPPAAAVPAPAPAQPDPVLIALRRPDDEGYASEPFGLSVDPGGSVMMRALVRNQSGIVDNYDLTVDGLPEGWWEAMPGTVYLVPFGAAGGSYEQEVEIQLAPPRSAEAEARDWPLTIVATSRATGAVVHSAPTTLTIGPYSELEASLAPERRSGRIEAGFTLTLANKANAPVEVALSGVDAEERLGFVFREPYVPPQRRKREGVDVARNAYERAEAMGVGRVGVEQMGKQALDRATAGAEGKVVRFLKRRKKTGREIRGLRLEPGERVEATVGVSPPKQIWIGRTVLHPFQVVAQPAGTDTPGPPVNGTFRQRQWLPWWLMIVVPLLIIAGIFLLSQRTASAEVPDVTASEDVFAAKALLEDAGFTLGETFEEPAPEGASPGAIIEQDPPAGESAEEGTAVTIKIAVGEEKVAVPDLTGQTTDQATATLTAAGFQLGRPLNEGIDPATATIANQIPVPESLEAAGAAIDVVLAAGAGTPTTSTPGGEEPAPTAPVDPTAPPPPVTDPGTPTAPGTSTPAPAAVPTPGGPPLPLPVPAGAPVVEPSPPTPGGGVEVPAVTGTSQTEAANALAALGLVPGVVSAASAEEPAGTVLSQEPAPGTEVAPGATVAITISRGYPAVIHDADGDIVRVGGATGEPVEPIAASEDIEEQANASFSTPLIAYRRGPEGSVKGVAPSAQIWAIDPNDPRSARPLTDSGFDDRRPAISPDGNVVAFVSNRGSNPEDYDVCFARTDASNAVPKCISDRDVNVSRPAWSPDGRSLIVTASDGPQTELLLLTSVVPSSPNPADWTPQGFVTDGMHKDRKTDQVLSSAFSPDGTSLAFSANWKSTTFTLWTVPVEGGVIGTEPEQQPFIAACELSWRPDGAELAIAQRNSTCDEVGRIVRVQLSAPNEQTLLSRLDAASGSPVWAPPAG